jgi:capsular exopolysaccharide synthesis family protein
VILGFGLAIGFIIMKDVVSDNIVTMQDVESSTMIPFLGSISHGNRRDRAIPIVAHTQSELGESFRSLRVNLQYLTLGKEDNVIGITSSVTNEGKTFCSINLAAALALSGRKTVLIDADLRRPRIAAMFNLKKKRGLSNFLMGACGSDDIIQGTPVPGLDVITSGPIPPNPLDLVGDPRMEKLIEELKQSYNTIVIDSPPIGPVSEYIILMKYTNANIYVVRSNYTSRAHLEKINRLYKDNKIQNVSILLNDAKPGANGYGYKYAYT